MNQGFTLIFDQYEELVNRIEKIIRYHGGKIIFDETFNHYLLMPVLKSLSGFLSQQRRGKT